MKIVRLCATLLALGCWSGVTVAASSTSTPDSNASTIQDEVGDWLTDFEFKTSGEGEPPPSKRAVHSDIL